MPIKSLRILDTGKFKLDGGAMFGVVPKSMWNKLNPSDENNMTDWAMRCLYIETENKKIVVDTGLGNVMDPKFLAHFYQFGAETLFSSLEKLEVLPTDITDVILTHLHFDHTGGSVVKNAVTDELEAAFPNATYWTHKAHFENAMNPNARERNSFIKDTFLPIQKAGKFKFFEQPTELFDDCLHTITLYGHTHAMTALAFTLQGKNFLYGADIFPSQWHINVPFVMAYDMMPLQTISEKELLLEAVIEQQWHIIFEHDPLTECATVKKDARGKFGIDARFKLNELFLP